jgi:hypothetical protein
MLADSSGSSDSTSRNARGSQASAARMPGTLFAAIDAPVPVQHMTTPKSASPEAR